MAPQGIAFAQTYMVASTMNDLHAERMAAYNAIQARGHEAWISENPPWTPSPSMHSLCTDMAARCDHFILILGPRYGFAPPGHFASDGLSVTELEYLAASADNPSKILVCLQHAALDTSNERQWRFIHEVLQHYDERSVLRFKTADDLRRKLKARLPRPPVASPAADILAYMRALEDSLALPPAAIELGLRTAVADPTRTDNDLAIQPASSGFIRGALSEFLARYKHVAIVADPGAGKTTLMRMFASAAANRLLASPSGKPSRSPLVSRGRAPVFVRAQELSRSLQSRQSSEGASARAVALAVGVESNSRLSVQTIEALLDRGEAILLVDGLDELASSRDILDVLHLLQSLEANELAVSTRPTVASFIPSTWRTCEIQQLDDAQVHALIPRILASYLPTDGVERVAEQFEDALASRFDLRVLVGTPLTLSLLLTVFLRTGQFPNEQVDLFRLTFNVVDRESLPQRALAFDRVLAALGLDIVIRGSDTFSTREALETGRRVLSSSEVNNLDQVGEIFIRSPFLRPETNGDWSFVSPWAEAYFAALALADMSSNERDALLRQQVASIRWVNTFSLLVSELRSRGRLEDAEYAGRLLIELRRESPNLIEPSATSDTGIAVQRPNVFISHSSRDNSFTRQLAEDLMRKAIRIWVDYAEIKDGAFLERIDAGLSRADWMILVLSNHALASRYVMLEFYAALARERKGKMRGILPSVGGDLDVEAVPPLMDSLHRYDGRLDYGVALQGIFLALGFDAA